MSATRHRQLFLFLVALILPSLVIAGLWGKLFVKEREGRDERAGKEHQREVQEIGRDVVSLLEAFRKSAQPGVAPTPGPLVFVGWLGDGRRLPWEDASAFQQFNRAGLAPELERQLDEAWLAELDKRYEAAGSQYLQALQSAREGPQRAFVQHGLARSLEHSKARAGGLEIYRRDLLTLPSNIVDDSGTPFACWAARALARSRTADRDILNRIEQDLGAPVALTRDTAAHWRDVAEVLRDSVDTEVRTKAPAVLKDLAERMRVLEQTDALRAEFSDLGITTAVWKTYGASDATWLIRMIERAGDRPLAVVVRARDIFQSVEAGGTGRQFQIVAGGSEGYLLDERVPDLRVKFLGEVVTPASSELPQLFFGLSLLVVVSLTLLAGYLAWRNTRREIRIAELRSQFVASVSHELKTPLTSIRMFAELLEMRSADEPTQAEYLNTIVNESERLTRLLNNVLDFSHIEHGQKSYSMEPSPLEEVVRSAMRVMTYPLAAQGFDLQAEIDGTMPLVSIDRDAIKQAVLNLLTNAMKYSGKSRAIELRVRRDDGDAVIQVTDHGIGIPPHEQARIFEKFYRANVPENHTISGTGLGLALVAHIVSAHRGRVHVDSRPGEGTTISMRLPVNAAPSPRPGGAVPASRTVSPESSRGSASSASVEARS